MRIKLSRSLNEKMIKLQEERRINRLVNESSAAAVEDLQKKGVPFMDKEVLKDVISALKEEGKINPSKDSGFQKDPDAYWKALAEDGCFFDLMKDSVPSDEKTKEMIATLLTRSNVCFDKDHWIREAMDEFSRLFYPIEETAEDANYAMQQYEIPAYLLFGFQPPAQVDESGVFVPRYGYFDEPIPGLMIRDKQDQAALATLSPNDIIIAKDGAEKAKGKVLCLGFHMGYFAYLVSQKEEVEEITIVDPNEELLHFFEKQILPRFSKEQQEKIRIVNDSIGSYLDFAERRYFDFVYLQMMEMESDLSSYLLYKKKIKELRKAKLFVAGEKAFGVYLLSFVYEILMQEYLKERGDKKDYLDEHRGKILYETLRSALRKVAIASEKDVIHLFQGKYIIRLLAEVL